MIIIHIIYLKIKRFCYYSNIFQTKRKEFYQKEKYIFAFCYFGTKNYTDNLIKEMIRIRRNNWQRRECNGCKEYNPECRQGACCIQKQENSKVKREKEDSS